MRKLIGFFTTVIVLGALMPQAFAQTGEIHRSGTVYVEVSAGEVVAGNSLIERTWTRSGWATTAFTDLRSGEGLSGGTAPDFTLDIGVASVPSDVFEATAVNVEEIPDGLRATVTLAPVAGTEPGLSATRIIEVYEGIAGMRTQTILNTLSPLVLRGYALEQVAAGNTVTPTIHAFRAGADWREPDWSGPKQGSIGDPHAGTWRDTDTVDEPGEAIAGPAQWISVAKDERSLFMVMERNDWPSSRAAYDGNVAKLNVDYSADIIILGPIEEEGHIENPAAGEAPGRHRVLEPGVPYPMEAAFVGFGANPDDEPWQFYKYLSSQRLDPYDTEITFNSNGTDANVRSDGAKDDMVEEVIAEVAPKARRLGIETFILDDGWQARSGDWETDCGDTVGAADTDPRWDGTEATAKFAKRYTDCNFGNVRDLIAPMELGLWMNPMHFHPRSHAYMNHPNWACKPVGDALGATSIVEPNGGSNDAGLGTWAANPEFMTHLESRIQNSITNWGVTYFKFDFLVWLDCAGEGDLYQHKEAFTAMLDRLIARNPHVTFSIDETNDYRLFPFESVTRGPSWFQNGSPEPHRLLHNMWNLSPYIPTYSLGQHFLGGNQYNRYPVDTLMAAALPSHLTFFSDLRHIPDSVIDQARPWTDFYKEYREEFAQMTYPLLADPMEEKWTALQTWNPEEGHGALLAFRQKDDVATKTISLRNVPAGMTFDLLEAPTGTKVGTATSEQLTNGLDITIPNKDGARVLVIVPSSTEEPDPTTTLTYTGEASARVGGALTLAANLAGAEGPLVGEPIKFTFRGETYQASTGADGRAVVVISPVAGPAGSNQLVASFAGSDRYSPSGLHTTIETLPGKKKK